MTFQNDQGGGSVGILTALQNLVSNISNLVTAFKNAFPQASSTISHSATAGTDTLPAAPAGFLPVTIGGVAYKIPIYHV